MLTNSIPLERIFNNDKMWYKYAGLDKKGKPIIEEYPHGAASMINARYYNFSDNKEELYNYWVEVIANKPEYERMNEEYSKLLKELDKKYKGNEKYGYCFGIIPLFQYYQALKRVGEITLQQMLDGVVENIDVILNRLTVGKVMSKWSEDSDWCDVISKVKYNKKNRIVTIEMVSFCAMEHYTHEMHEETFDLNTENGFYNFGEWLEHDRGHWESLDELIEDYEQHVADVKAFISSVKKINSKKEKLYGKD
jgi:hypothetical protein